MCRDISSPRNRRVWRFAAIILLALALVVLPACKSRNEATTETKAVVEATGTVQATITAEPTPTAEPTATATPTVTVIPAPAQAPAPAPKAPVGPWPAKVGSFAKSVKAPVWYPKSVPKGLKVDSLDVVEFDPGAGLVCDIVFTDGNKTVQFTQGSPTNRSYDIVSVGKVPWGGETADVVHEDPADTTTPILIVYNNGGNFAELSGDVSEAQLKAIAASMVQVK